MFFRCKHPFSALIVEKQQTVTVVDRDFEHVDYHLKCVRCKKYLTLTHARMIGGVGAFLKRGELVL